jgi:hypothetical protein
VATSSSSDDPTPRHLAQLSPVVQPRALALVNAARQAGIRLVITSSRRTAAEQARLVAAGRSRRPDSLHLTGRAFDVDVLGIGRDRVPRDFWAWLGPIGERLGLRWGGRWQSPYDPGHFEL